MKYMLKVFLGILLIIIAIMGIIEIYTMVSQKNFGNFYLGDDDFGYDCLYLDESDTLDKCPQPGRPGRFFKHYYKDSIRTSFCGGGGAVISPLVVDAIADSVFILVSAKPLDSIYEFKLLSYQDENGMITDTSPTDADCARALRKSKLYQYWIIKKAKYEIYGPLSKSEYKQMKKKLKVPEKLKLDFEK